VDLGVFFRVIWRFKVVVAIGFVLALTLATLSLARVDFKGGSPPLSYREKEQWQSYTTLIISPRGFPWGRSVFSLEFDPSRFATLATIYANLAQSDAVKRIMVRDWNVQQGAIEAQPVLSSPNNSSAPPLPLMTIAATTSSARSSTAVAERATAAFLDFLRAEQSDNGIPANKRVVVAEIKHATQPVLLKGRSKTTPVAVFLAVMIAFIGLAFVLENLRPRVREVPQEARDDHHDPVVASPARRSA
jgi:hypothetical protein